ncbi:hypothetical protein EDC04DRAFT_2604960 [Pisolithus marmoratus]|nr:hypothetical protein EDC04DRAFT_2604960 [Pisolithus marmoratus]
MTKENDMLNHYHVYTFYFISSEWSGEKYFTKFSVHYMPSLLRMAIYVFYFISSEWSGEKYFDFQSKARHKWGSKQVYVGVGLQGMLYCFSFGCTFGGWEAENHYGSKDFMLASVEPEWAPVQLARKAASRSGGVGHLQLSGILLRSQKTWNTRRPVPYSSLVDLIQDVPMTLVMWSITSAESDSKEEVHWWSIAGHHRSSLSLVRQCGHRWDGAGMR